MTHDQGGRSPLAGLPVRHQMCHQLATAAAPRRGKPELRASPDAPEGPHYRGDTRQTVLLDQTVLYSKLSVPSQCVTTIEGILTLRT